MYLKIWKALGILFEIECSIIKNIDQLSNDLLYDKSVYNGCIKFKSKDKNHCIRRMTVNGDDLSA